jgi:hypothetical protein
VNTAAVTVNFDAAVAADADGTAAPDELALLEAHKEEWATTLRRWAVETDQALASMAQLEVPERDHVMADLRAELMRITTALRRVDPESARARLSAFEPEAEVAPEPGEPVLQASWIQGRVAVWAGATGLPPAPVEHVQRLVEEAGASSAGWTARAGIRLPDGSHAAALEAPVDRALGWLVAVAAGSASSAGASVGPSVAWLGAVAAWATELVAGGRIVPSLVRTDGGPRSGTGTFEVRWLPAPLDRAQLTGLTARMPGVVAVAEGGSGRERVCREAVTGMVDAICRAGTRRLVAPAVPPRPRGAAEMAETFLARLDGTPFEATVADGAELTARLERWARPVTTDAPVLVLQLDPPDRGKAWRLSVHTRGDKGKLTPVEVTIATAKDPVRRAAEAQLTRLERLLPVLTRPGGARRGEVLLATDEAWQLMTVDGPVVADAGFDVRVPALSRRRPSPTLRLFAEGANAPAAVGAAQLSKVRWSVCFDDVELTAADLAALVAQARPLVRSRGRWVELDRADLAEAAAALAQQSAAAELTGGAILRHALGLEGGGLAGRVSVDGSGWAADLLRRATSAPPEPLPAPDGFVGHLREYQAQSRGWLKFLDEAGLGGCLALDMGLGKTPILLAHLLDGKRTGAAKGASAGAAGASRASLVVTPPAVLGNWAAEAAKFTPGLRVVSHHGPGRADTPSRVGRLATEADIVLTTYATAVRDVELLAAVDWARVVIDEAQAIKNPASDTAQALRRIPARSRVALTGTPVENGLGDLWSILDFTNPGLVGSRNSFIANLSRNDESGGGAESALRALNGLLVFRRTKAEPAIAEELPDKIDQLDHCTMTAEQIGLYQAVLDDLVAGEADADKTARQSRILAAITALKQICNHPTAYTRDGEPLAGRSGKLARLEEIVESVFAAGERVLVFTHFATWGEKLAGHLTQRFGMPIVCYHGGLTTTVRDRMIREFQQGKGAGALVLSLKAGGSGLNLTAANHVVLYDRWWNPAAEDQARDRSWRLGQTHAVISHRLVCPGTVDERVEEVVAGKRRIADLVLPKQSSLGDLGAEQLRAALGLRSDEVLEEEAGGRSDEVDAA